jgi:hypothetical protein
MCNVSVDIIDCIDRVDLIDNVLYFLWCFIIIEICILYRWNYLNVA